MADSIEYRIAVNEEPLKEMLVALLSNAGATGFEEEKNLLKAFLPYQAEQELEFEKIIEDNELKYSKSIIKEKNWNAKWEADFKPVTIGHFCAIRAGFHAAPAGIQHDIIITPKMSFGTGHHATTHLMVSAMAGLSLMDRTVFDFGTGTGVLAVLAEKCGASAITAIDNDDWSIANARENFIVNKCDKIILFKADKFEGNSKYEVILANINRNVILQSLPQLQQHLAQNGVLLLSGLLTGDEPVIAEAALKNKLVVREKSEMGGWICLRLANG